MELSAALMKRPGPGRNFMVIYKKIPYMSKEGKEQVLKDHMQYFPGLPIVMMYMEGKRSPDFFGREDLIQWMTFNSRHPQFETYTF